MPNFKFSNLKKPLLGAALLKTAPALMGKGGSVEECRKSQLGVNHLILEEAPGYNAIICTPKEAETVSTTVPACESAESASQCMPSDLIVAVDPLVAVAPDEESRYIEIVFSVREMWADHEDQVLLLVYSQKLTPYPEILTPSSMNKFQLELNTLEILGIYDIPAQSMFATPSTRIGKANPVSRSIMSFSVNLDIELLSIMMEKQDSIYFQAALMSRADYNAARFDKMILSEVDVIRFVMGNDCPEDRQNFTESAIPGAVFTK